MLYEQRISSPIVNHLVCCVVACFDVVSWSIQYVECVYINVLKDFGGVNVA